MLWGIRKDKGRLAVCTKRPAGHWEDELHNDGDNNDGDDQQDASK